jgi:hypothetical protein
MSFRVMGASAQWAAGLPDLRQPDAGIFNLLLPSQWTATALQQQEDG